MDENDLLEMGRTLTEKFKKFEEERKLHEARVAAFQRYMVMLYTYSRELDMLVGSDPGYPLIIKFMIERLRGITSQLLFKESRSPDDDDDTFDMYLQ
jgi:hypothetical protein|tara:strand:+ start:2174 stop:2464 length:291 start_codon:yes stop_codon:yes gene_type:complete